jgi:hypothetical protein
VADGLVRKIEPSISVFRRKPDILSSVAAHPFWCMDLREELRGTRTEAELILEAEIRRSKPPDLSACRDCPHVDALRSWLRWLEAQLKEVTACMPLKLKSFEDFKQLTEGSTVFLYRIQEWSGGGYRAVLMTSQYVVELSLREKQLPELKRWLALKGAVETEGYVELSEVLRR